MRTCLYALSLFAVMSPSACFVTSAPDADGGDDGAASGGETGSGGRSSGGDDLAVGGSFVTGGANSAGGSSNASGGAAAATVRVVGRTTLTAEAKRRFSWPGVSFQARFSGTQVSMLLTDGGNKNRFTVVLDGEAPQVLTTSSGGSLQLASGLANASHEVVIWRNTEAGGGVSEFSGLSGFDATGELLAPATGPDRRIEVIGDSLSVGAGVEGTSTSCSPNIDAYTNNYLAYGSVAARSVGADVTTIAWSGIGVYRNCCDSGPTMPQRYDYAVPNDSTAWDFADYQPHVVVINLGTNDFGPGNPGQPYVDAYVSFVKHVRSKYTATRFILIDMYGGARLALINQTIATLKSDGETQVEMLSFNSVPNNNTGCNQHPNTVAQAAMGNILATRLRALLGW